MALRVVATESSAMDRRRGKRGGEGRGKRERVVLAREKGAYLLFVLCDGLCRGQF